MDDAYRMIVTLGNGTLRTNGLGNYYWTVDSSEQSWYWRLNASVMAEQRMTDEYLFDVYRRWVGEPEQRSDVYLGFGLFLGGIALSVVALVLFVWSATLEPRSSMYFTWVQPAYALGMVSLPMAMLGIVVLLPSDKRVLGVCATGVAIATVAVIGFVWAYPSDWNMHGENYTVYVVATYAIGLATVSASTGAALIAHYLDAATDATPETSEVDDESEETYTDEEIRSDIDEAMEGVELSWGGVERTEHRKLSFSNDDLDVGDVDIQAKTTRSTGVDAQVAGLKGLKGGETKTATSSETVDDQTQKLTELRQRRQQAAQERPTEGLLPRLKDSIDSLKSRLQGPRGS